MVVGCTLWSWKTKLKVLPPSSIWSTNHNMKIEVWTSKLHFYATNNSKSSQNILLPKITFLEQLFSKNITKRKMWHYRRELNNTMFEPQIYLLSLITLQMLLQVLCHMYFVSENPVHERSDTVPSHDLLGPRHQYYRALQFDPQNQVIWICKRR